MLVLFLKLLLAHIIGDFVLQTKKMIVRRKENALYLLLHIFIHASLLCLVFYKDIEQWWQVIVSISVAHLAIDSVKILCERRWPLKPILLFVLDQILHLVVIFSVVLYFYKLPVDMPALAFTSQVLLCVIAFLLVAVVAPVFLRVFFSKWDRENVFQTQRTETLLDAGLLIGVMERLIIVLFIQVGFLSGIGFLLAAKSIFRFGDLATAKNTKFTEYVLVGTFASFFIAIVVGYALRIALKYC